MRRVFSRLTGFSSLISMFSSLRLSVLPLQKEVATFFLELLPIFFFFGDGRDGRLTLQK